MKKKLSIEELTDAVRAAGSEYKEAKERYDAASSAASAAGKEMNAADDKLRAARFALLDGVTPDVPTTLLIK